MRNFYKISDVSVFLYLYYRKKLCIHLTGNWIFRAQKERGLCFVIAYFYLFIICCLAYFILLFRFFSLFSYFIQIHFVFFHYFDILSKFIRRFFYILYLRSLFPFLSLFPLVYAVLIFLSFRFLLNIYYSLLSY